MNLIHFNKNNVNKSSKNSKAGVNSTSKMDGNKKGLNYGFVMSNKHFFHGTHESLSIISTKIFSNFYSKLSNRQRIILHCFFEALNNGDVITYSEIKRTKLNRISYIIVEFNYQGKLYRKCMFYFFGLSKLLSFIGKAKFNLSLKELLKIANQK